MDTMALIAFSRVGSQERALYGTLVTTVGPSDAAAAAAAAAADAGPSGPK